MSAPQTNIEKQVERHRAPILGISAVLIFATVLLVLFVIFVVDRGGAPEGADVQIDARTGAEVPADETAPVEGN